MPVFSRRHNNPIINNNNINLIFWLSLWLPSGRFLDCFAIIFMQSSFQQSLMAVYFFVAGTDDR